MEAKPLVSIGVPVYNEARYIRKALDSILAQDYQNLEIIIADNASNDGTREICREYASRDPRIRLFENKYNRGTLKNHSLVFQLSQGDFFSWGAGHDFYHPSYVSKTLEVMMTNPGVVMCCTQSVFLDVDGNILRTTKAGFDTRSQPPVERFKSLFSFMATGGTANIFHALYRSETIANIELRKALGTDVVFLAELSLIGEMFQVDEVLYFRLVNEFLMRQEKIERWVNLLLEPRRFTPKAVLPYFYVNFEYFNVLEESDLSYVDKQTLYDEVIKETHKIQEKVLTEVRMFVQIIRQELKDLEQYPVLKQYRAVQVLDMIEKIALLGFENDEVQEIRMACSYILRDCKVHNINQQTISVTTRLKRLTRKIYDVLCN